jgi:hypothetical protein
MECLHALWVRCKYGREVVEYVMWALTSLLSGEKVIEDSKSLIGDFPALPASHMLNKR